MTNGSCIIANFSVHFGGSDSLSFHLIMKIKTNQYNWEEIQVLCSSLPRYFHIFFIF